MTAAGFQTLRRVKITLRVADKLNLPLEVTLGQVSEAVTVTGQQEAIETGSADRGHVFDPIKVQELPLNGRQTYMLMSLTPGVAQSHPRRQQFSEQLCPPPEGLS